MKNKLSLLLIVAFALSISHIIQASNEKTYLYAFKLKAATVYKIMPNTKLQPNKAFVLFWASPWPLGVHEMHRIINNFSRLGHVNKGYKIKQIDKKLIKAGKIKFGLVKVIGGSPDDINRSNGMVK